MRQERQGEASQDQDLVLESPPEQKPRRRQRVEVLPYETLRRPHQDIEIDSSGNIHIYWGSGKARIHSGGPTGFNDIGQAINQHQRVILNYLGYREVGLTQQEAQELLLPDTDKSLAAFATRLRRNPMSIPGEAQEILTIAQSLQNRISSYTFLTTNLQRDKFSTGLFSLSRRLGRVRDPFKVSAARHIETASESKNASQIMDETTKASIDLMERHIRIMRIVRATINRLNILYDTRDSYENIIEKVYLGLLGYSDLTDKGRLTQGARQRLNEYMDTKNYVGALTFLKRVDGQPYKDRVDSSDVRRLERIPEYLSNDNTGMVSVALRGATQKLWRVVEEKRNRKEEKYYGMKLPTDYEPNRP